VPSQESRSRKAWKERTILIGRAKKNIQSAGSRLLARSRRQIEEGLKGANRADWVLDLEHPKQKIKVACPPKTDRRRLGVKKCSGLKPQAIQS
jgi:hypothetical protein